MFLKNIFLIDFVRDSTVFPCLNIINAKMKSVMDNKIINRLILNKLI